MLDLSRINKIQVTAADGKIIVEADNEQFSFPRMFVNDIPVTNIMMIKGKNFPELAADTSVFIIAYMKNGDRYQYVGRVKMSLDYQLNVQIRDDYGTLIEERRRFFKVQSNLRCLITAVERDGEIIELQNPVLSVIKNLSIGGIFLDATDPPFKCDDILLISFKGENELVSANAKILRLQYSHEGTLLGYGCQFINVDKRQEGVFAKVVNMLQLQQRQEELEKKFRKEEGMKRVKGTGG